MAAVLLLVALLAWTVGIARMVVWIIDLIDSRAEAAYRADQLVAQARAEFADSEPCDTTVAAEHRAEQMADATSGYYFDAEVSRG